MKIAIDARYAEGKLTGIGCYIKELALALDKSKCHVILCYSKHPKTNIEGKGIHKVILKSNNRYYFEQFLLPIYLKKEKVDLYHAAGNLGVPFFCPVPSVLTVHDIVPLIYPNYFCFSKIPFISKFSFLIRMYTSLYKANEIITDSEFSRECIIEKFKVPQNKIKVIPLGVNIESMDTNFSRRIIKDKYIINNGGIDIRKNLFRLIAAFAKISSQFSGLKLVITGENSILVPELQKYAQKNGVGNLLYFPGYVDDKNLCNLIENASCLCLPTEIEGFGLPVLQGMVAGTPVVTSNCSSIPEIAGDAAFLVDPLNVDDIAVGLKKVLTDITLRKNLIKKGFIQAQKFKWQKTVTKTIKIYQKAIK